MTSAARTEAAPRLLYFLGIDGSGKTTLARSLVAALGAEGRPARYFYAQHTPILMLPAKWLARRTMLGAVNPGSDYRAYSKRKSGASRGHPRLARLYAGLWLVDYALATHLRLLGPRLRRMPLVVDRYYLDVVVNISQTLGLTDEEMKDLVRCVRLLFPKPSAVFFLDLPEEVAFARKDDIPSVQYLSERRRRYRVLDRELVFVKLDGQLPPQVLLATALGQVRRLWPHVGDRIAADSAEGTG